VAAVTTGAEPDEIALQHFLFHAQERHPYDLSRIVPLVNDINRARSAARFAGKTCPDGLSPRLSRYAMLERRIERIQFDAAHGIALEPLFWLCSH
jgi:hypothetical protein